MNGLKRKTLIRRERQWKWIILHLQSRYHHCDRVKHRILRRLDCRHNWSDRIALPRYHACKKIKAVKPIIAKEFEEQAPRFSELQRQIRAREAMLDKFRGQVDLNDDDSGSDIDVSL